MKYIYLDDIEFLERNLSKIRGKKIFLTSSIGVYEVVKQKLNTHVILLQSKNYYKHYQELKKYFFEFQKILKLLDRDKIIKTHIENKDLNLFFNSHRYATAMDCAAFKFITKSIFSILKKRKVKKLHLYGNLRFNFFSNEVFYKELKSKGVDLIFLKSDHFVKKNNFDLLKTYTLDQFFLYIKKIFSNLYLFSKKKNLAIEPSWDFFYSKYKITNTFFLNLRKKKFNIIDENQINENINKDYRLKKYKSKIVLFDLIKKTLVIDKKLSLIFEYLKNYMKSNNIKNCIWSCDPDSIAANVIQYLRKKNIKIYGIQHGGAYNVIDYSVLHNLSDFNFCDKFLSYGNSKSIKDKKIINFGSFKSLYYLRNKKNLNSRDDKKLKILFIVGGINEVFLNKNSFIDQYNFQKNVCEFLNKKNINPIIKIPKNISILNFPIINKINNDYKNFIVSEKKIFQEINNSNPKIIILDRLSTTLYECLFYDSNIILFLDKKEKPYKDVLQILKKRVYIVYNLYEFKNVFEKLLKTKINYQDNSFLKKYFLLKHNKQNKELLKKLY